MLKVSDCLMFTIWLVKALFHLAGITGGGLTTLFGYWREADLCLRYPGKQGAVSRLKGELFVWSLLMMSSSAVTCCRHSFLYLFVSCSCQGCIHCLLLCCRGSAGVHCCIHHSLSCQRVHQAQNGTVAGFQDLK